MCHVESSLGSHMVALGNLAGFLRVRGLALARELALGLEEGGDVVDGALVELDEGCRAKKTALAAGESLERGWRMRVGCDLRLSTEKQE